MNKIIFLLIFQTITYSLLSQKTLTIAEATEITLANNYGIQIAKNNLTVAENNTNKSVNGYLPTVAASGGVNGSLGGSRQVFSNGMEAVTSNAFTWGGNGAVNANYTLFDKGRDLRLKQLKEAVNLSSLQLRQTIEQNLLQVYNGYYQVAQLAENINVLREAISISKDRLRRANYQLEYGQGSGLEVLNAKVDIQRDSVNILNATMQLANAKRNLNTLMNRTETDDFNVTTEVTYDENLQLEALLASAKNENTALKINRQNLTVNEMNLQIIESEKKPTITSGASYNLNYTDNPEGAFFDTNRSQGLGANVGVNWTIFDGSRKIRKQNAVLNLSNQKLQIDQLQTELERDITNAWANYQNALFILEVEKSAVETNRENFARTEEQVKIGRLTSIEFRQAQLNLLNAQTNLNRAKFDAKLLEVQVLQLVGRL